MNVNLTPTLERLVQAKVASGLYNNQSEVIREALRMLAEQDRARSARIDHLKDALADGLSQANRGELHDGPAVVRKARTRLRSRRTSAKSR